MSEAIYTTNKRSTRFKLIALDLDGTLLNDDKKISDTSKYWINKAIQHNIIVIFATGRGIQTVQSFWDELTLPFPMVLLNGAEIWSEDRSLIKRTIIPTSYIYQLHKLALQADGYWGYSTSSLTGSDHWTDSSFQEQWMKFGIHSQNETTLEAIKQEINKWNALQITSSHPQNLEISVKGITKESGVRTVCEHLNIRMDEVIAIGDSDNDRLLLEAAGLGIAMGNADEAIKQIANKITLSNNEHGVAEAIKRYVFENIEF